MKKITIELSDYEYKDLSEKAKAADLKIEEYIVNTSRSYKTVYKTGYLTYKELQEAYEKIKDLQKENKILKQNLGIKK